MARGRCKFTPEAFEQIRQMIAAGIYREEIAAKLGTTQGSLQVNCSKAGISLKVNGRKRTRKPGPPKPPAETPETIERKGFPIRLVNQKIKVAMEPEALMLLTMRAEKLGVTVDVVAQKVLEATARDDLYAAIVDEAA